MYSGDHSMRSCPRKHAYHKGSNFECSQTDGGRLSGPCLVRGALLDIVRGTGRARVVQLLEMQIQTRSCNSIPSPCKTNFRCTNFPRFCRKIAPVSIRGFITSCPSHKVYHKGLSFECRQTDGGRQYGGVQPHRGALEHEVARQSVRAVSRILNEKRSGYCMLDARSSCVQTSRRAALIQPPTHAYNTYMSTAVHSAHTQSTHT